MLSHGAIAAIVCSIAAAAAAACLLCLLCYHRQAKQLANIKMELMQLRSRRSARLSDVELAARPLELAAGPLELAAAELPAAEIRMENEASSPPPALSKRSEPPGSDVEATAESAVTGKVLVATGIIKARPKIGPVPLK